MDIKLLKKTARNSVALMLVVIVISIIISKENQSMIYANSSDKQVMSSSTQDLSNQNISNNYIDTQNRNELEIKEEKTFSSKTSDFPLGDKYLVIKKQNQSAYNITLQDLYMDRSIQITITNLKDKSFNDSSIVCINQGNEYTGIPEMEAETLLSQTSKKMHDVSVDSDPVKEFHIQYSKDDDNNFYTAVINIHLDRIYAYKLYQDDENIYIDLKRPKDVYDRIIVIDPGHGGTDGGTTSKNDEFYEKDINLSLAMYLKDLLDKKDIKVYYTRTTDQTVYLNPRVYLANEVEADFFLSIHCNSNESSEPYGCEVLYNELLHKQGIKTEEFANICLVELSNVTHKINRGLVSGSEMLIIQKANMPTALIEVAFMSNEEEMKFLSKEENKRNVAIALDKAIERAFTELKP